jgi:hypothetical protein
MIKTAPINFYRASSGDDLIATLVKRLCSYAKLLKKIAFSVSVQNLVQPLGVWNSTSNSSAAMLKNGKFTAHLKQDFNSSVEWGSERVEKAKGNADSIHNESNQSVSVASKQPSCLKWCIVLPVMIAYSINRYPIIISHLMWFNKNIIETKSL